MASSSTRDARGGMQGTCPLGTSGVEENAEHWTPTADNSINLHLREEAHGAAVVACRARDTSVQGVGGKG